MSLLVLPMRDSAFVLKYLNETVDVKTLFFKVAISTPGVINFFLTVRILDSKFFEGEEHVKRALFTRPLLECTT